VWNNVNRWKVWVWRDVERCGMTRLWKHVLNDVECWRTWKDMGGFGRMMKMRRKGVENVE
jgi:hypothetical protein